MNPKYFKLNEDDILSIVKDYLLEQMEFETSQGHLNLVITPEGDINLLAAFSNLEDDSIQQIDLQEVGNQIDYNGPVSSLKNSSYIDLNNPETKERIQKLLAQLEDE